MKTAYDHITALLVAILAPIQVRRAEVNVQQDELGGVDDSTINWDDVSDLTTLAQGYTFDEEQNDVIVALMRLAPGPTLEREIRDAINAHLGAAWEMRGDSKDRPVWRFGNPGIDNVPRGQLWLYADDGYLMIDIRYYSERY
jgi:hypothetical protein